MPVAKEQIRQIISENNLNSVTDVNALLRDSFKDILQELMDAELDARGMGTRDIHDQLGGLYGIELSAGMAAYENARHPSLPFCLCTSISFQLFYFFKRKS